MLQDVRYAVRALLGAPGFTLSAVLALALGIGANTAVFSAVYAVLLKPLPYTRPDELVQLFESDSRHGIERAPVSAGTFVDWRARAKTLEGFAAYFIPFGGETLWTLNDTPQIVRTAAVSPSLFALFRVQPIAGQPLRPEEAPAPPNAVGQFVISYAFWQRAFGGAPDVVGRRVMIEGRLPREIVGVMPPGFDFPEGTEAWTSNALVTVAPAQRRARTFFVVGRLAPGKTIADARTEIEGLSRRLEQEQTASNAGWGARVDPLGVFETAGSRLALLALLAAVGGVLLIGCANVANLLLARAVARSGEMAVRAALGAAPSRLVRLCLIESALLSAAGVGVGLALASALTRVLVRLAPPDVPRLGSAAISSVVLAFAVAAGVACATLTGLAPAIQAARADRGGVLRRSDRAATGSHARIRRWLMALQMGVVVVLLTSALLFLRTFVNLRGVDLGFRPRQALVVEARWPVGTLFQTAPGTRPWPRIQRAVDGLLAAVGALPGVEAVGLLTAVPLSGDPYSGTVWRADAPGASGTTPPTDPRLRWQADIDVVTPGYFPALGIPFLRGRNFSETDRFNDEQLKDGAVRPPGAAIVSSAFASRYFSGEDPVGRTIVLFDDQTFGAAHTIVGVVSDVRVHGVGDQPVPAVYIPHAQHPDVIRPSIVVRAAVPPGTLAAAIRARIAGYDPRLLVLKIRPMDDVVSGALSRPRFNLLLLTAFAVIALALAAVGIHGVLAYLVTERTREIGIRVALGARAADVLRLVLRDALGPVAAGGVAGLMVSLAVARSVRSMLYGVTPLDVVSFVAAPVLLGVVALVACYVPARRAMAVDPLVALRED
jgi:predicted permease